MQGAYPILSCEAAKAFETNYFAGDETREWAAMVAAGQAVAKGIRTDFEELGPWPVNARVLVLLGKGHNAGDALIAATALHQDLATAPTPGQVLIDVALVLDERTLRPLARRAWENLIQTCGPDLRVVRTTAKWAEAYDVVIDGVFGFQFHGTLDSPVAAILAKVNAWPVRLRAAVDLPSGLASPDAFRADFTYATGILKAPLLQLPNAGRVRFLPLGFPLQNTPTGDHGLGSGVLDELRALRPSWSDKRSNGHVLIIAGSRRYPGAALMATLAALRGGAGLVSAAVPESLVAAFSAQAPEAIWLGLPETPEGGLALEGFSLVRAAFERATALVLGPGLGRERETQVLAQEIVATSPHPLVIDADALLPEIVMAGQATRVLTPHAGEWTRIAEAVPAGAIVVRKGPITRIERTHENGAIYHSFFGGPVLARGGSGDILAGLAGAMLARAPDHPLDAAIRAVVWHGAAADTLARKRGATAVRTTELLDFLSPALRESAGW